MLVSLNQAFDQRDIDDLLFLSMPGNPNLQVSGDGVLKFSRLIASGLVGYYIAIQGPTTLRYSVVLTEKGRLLVSAWRFGDRNALTQVLGGA